MRHARIRRIAAWLTLGAMLYAAASPLLAAWRFQSAPEILAQICTHGGLKSAGNPPYAPTPNHRLPSQQCVFCLGGAWQPPAPAGLDVIVAPAATEAPAFVRSSLLPPEFHALRPHGPRAPPRS